MKIFSQIRIFHYIKIYIYIYSSSSLCEIPIKTGKISTYRQTINIMGTGRTREEKSKRLSYIKNPMTRSKQKRCVLVVIDAFLLAVLLFMFSYHFILLGIFFSFFYPSNSYCRIFPFLYITYTWSFLFSHIIYVLSLSFSIYNLLICIVSKRTFLTVLPRSPDRYSLKWMNDLS
jgi:hypothetical protein